MNRCPDERDVERAALRLAEREAAEIETPPEDLAPFLEHAKTCVRCSELLSLFLDVERTVRSDVEVETATVVVLHEVREGPVIRLSDAERTTGAFALAADASGGEVRGVAAPRARAYESRDRRYFVRLLPNPAGEGATAVLVEAPDPPNGKVAMFCFDDEVRPFDDGIHAILPRVPGARIEIRYT